MMPALILERFIKKTNKSDSGCWEWKAQKYPTGYGSFWMNRKNQLAHRASWQIFHGEIPDNLCVCHKCDNRSCVNPDHLFLGSHKENTQDMVKKKRRFSIPRFLDENQEIQAVVMYKNGMTQRQIAKHFSVHQRTLWKYLHKHLPVKNLSGEENNNSRLTQKQVNEIRRMYIPYEMGYTKLSKLFNVHYSTIERIIVGKIWKNN